MRIALSTSSPSIGGLAKKFRYLSSTGRAFQVQSDDLSLMAGLAQGLSHAEICRACDEAAKAAVLDDRRQIALADVQQAIRMRQERRRTVK